MQDQVSASMLRPLRLNFAQVCIWCGTRWCESPECVARHDRSTWTVCSMCDGGTVEVEDLDEPLPVDGLADMQAECRCVFGVVQLVPAGGLVEGWGREVVAVAR